MMILFCLVGNTIVSAGSSSTPSGGSTSTGGTSGGTTTGGTGGGTTTPPSGGEKETIEEGKKECAKDAGMPMIDSIGIGIAI